MNFRHLCNTTNLTQLVCYSLVLIKPHLDDLYLLRLHLTLGMRLLLFVLYHVAEDAAATHWCVCRGDRRGNALSNCCGYRTWND